MTPLALTPLSSSLQWINNSTSPTPDWSGVGTGLVTWSSDMKTTTTLRMAGIIAVAVMSVALSHTELDTTGDAIAADSDAMSFEISCTGASTSALIPSVTAYTITVPAGQADSINPAGYTGTYQWTTPVTNRGESMDNPGTLTSNSFQNNRMIYSHYAPYMVLSGEGCTAYNKGRLSATGDASNDDTLDVGVVTTGETSWSMVITLSSQIDTAITPVKIIGDTGVLMTNDLSDGSDADMFQNGEIAFGGTNSGQGGYLFMISLKLFEDTVTGSQEDVTFTMTATN